MVRISSASASAFPLASELLSHPAPTRICGNVLESRNLWAPAGRLRFQLSLVLWKDGRQLAQLASGTCERPRHADWATELWVSQHLEDLHPLSFPAFTSGTIATARNFPRELDKPCLSTASVYLPEAC